MWLVPRECKKLVDSGLTATDVNKKDHVVLPRPVSLPFLLVLVFFSVYVIFFYDGSDAFVISLVVIIAFVVGMIDDLTIRKGWFKPVMLLACFVPIFLFGAYESELIFPLIGAIALPVFVYIFPLILMPSLVANSFNSIDVLNGVVSGVLVVSSGVLALMIFWSGNIELSIMSIGLFVSSILFLRYHKYPSKLFIGDSGTLMFGAAYAAIAIIGNVEVFAVIAISPLIINSFLFLVSVKKIVEHREIKEPPVLHDQDMYLYRNPKSKTITLVTLILGYKHMSEKSISNRIVLLTILSSLFSFILFIITTF